MDKAIFILGPTGVGKTDISINLAIKFNGEIISCDSVQVFKGFDIGSAKVTKDEMRGITHYGLDICKPNDYFSVYDYCVYARKKIADICRRGKLPIIVGGTCLFAKALTQGFNFGQTSKNDEFRQQMFDLAEKEGRKKVWEKLAAVNPTAAASIDKNNLKRVVRALELETFGSKQEKHGCDFEYLLFALNLDRPSLYQRINHRSEKMFDAGLVGEVQGLLDAGVKLDSQPMKAIGYKEVAAYLNGEIDLDRAIDLVKQHSRNYAKRQLTFLRGMDGVRIIDASNSAVAGEKIAAEVEKFLKGKRNEN